MTRRRPGSRLAGLFACILIGAFPMSSWSDEGMWLLNEPPTARLQEKYQFALTPQWLEHAQLASIRFNSGGSASFVSPDGLIITNHHVGSDFLQKLSTAQDDLLKNGFYAPTREQERKCPDLEINILQSIQDVTDRVNAAVKPEMAAAEAFAARRAVISAIEKESLDATGLRSDVVTLYQGAVYHLYRYRKYTDVRLVFAPESEIASFGGDVDNFEYPRHSLDICFFRAYDNNQPVKPPHWLKWSTTGPTADDVVFVTGHPGTTNRLETVAKLRHRRDVTLPYTLNRLRAAEAALLQFGERDPANARIAQSALHRVANARKAFSGQFQGLLDPAILRQKLQSELALAQSPKLTAADRAELAKAIEAIETAQKTLAPMEVEFSLLERGDAFASELFAHARMLVRLASESTKPNAERLREFRESNLESLRLSLFSDAPIEKELERVRLQQSLTFLAEQLGGGSPLVVKILSGKSIPARVEELLNGSKLFDAAERKRLADGGAKAIDDSRDEMILLARLIDPEARAVRKRYETEVEEPERQGYAALAKARFTVYGREVAPDATFTLRLAYGRTIGYQVDGVDLPFHTTFGSLFEKAERLQFREPFNLPERWKQGKAKLDLAVPFNFVSTADTIGGNSGSPVLNRAGEFIGINFDRNRHGLVRNFVYTDVQARHIAVHSAGILEVLRKLYDCPALIAEITGGK
ncbi:S46 family peptidase [Tuwongella immobilis]|uniref:Dipeptidyl-peptidase n=1 Tax=Tuwongella immobilis TaxID=692036 RepID=A0A6C2YIH1_9BACT|nr:S46 family peptidase [Tuwongella immobilis]VIP01059.1 peptidase s46 : Uncharacterized protein OS=Pedosphaera parvula (strain Ellin514) GN=Cflav_PD2575 PE=4 SV=1: Peptidase_S46 [Tuwongella immobilis]VTR97543.1 peptidase s46 : Uncharacterized protein OS=Pedosphaera parvula (strain Ellin514) GN=Cflav_PD2575 PE=4 SV=1: Peptidase_S46 [Tuwongella immobilis]